MSSEPQNIYDNPDFFDGYARLRQNPHSANTLLIDPTRDAMLPDLQGKHILDLGCGAGGFCRRAIEEGATSVIGVDISERMLETAKAAPISPHEEPRLTYIQSPLETFAPAENSKDLIVSILAFHYLAEIGPLFGHIARALVSGGTFLFCVEHPITTAQQGRGWVTNEKGERICWAVDNYSEEGIRVEEWLVPGVEIYHRTLATYLNSVIAAGLQIVEVTEPKPTDEVIAAAPHFAQERRRPAFLFIKAVCP